LIVTAALHSPLKWWEDPDVPNDWLLRVDYYVTAVGTKSAHLPIPKPGPTCTKKVSVKNITAIGYENTATDYNPPINAIDGNLTTRWANKGNPSWILADMGTSQKICRLDIAWYKGDVGRKYNFMIEISPDASTFSQVYSGTSTGTMATPTDTYAFAATDARYVRITVKGNDDADPELQKWASIRELGIFGP